MDKLYAIQDVFISVQSALDEAASYGERIKKWVSPSERVLKTSLMHVSKISKPPLFLYSTVNWTVPFLSWLAITALCLATLLLYLIPLRYLVLAWGEPCSSQQL